jgi:hypothetical protein
MAITEHDRHRMYQRLEAVLASEEATTLMEHLPPVGWADVATKRDLDHFADKLRAEWNRELRITTLAIVTAIGVLNSISTGVLLAMLG